MNKYTKELVAEIASHYQNRRAFKVGHEGAYRAALRNGWLNIVCDHMKKSNRGFDVNQPGILYQLEFTFPNGDKAWKVGITNGPPSKRISSLGVRKGVRVQVSHVRNYIDGAQAAEDERQLHREFKDLRYKGLRFLSNGHTEVYSEPLIG
jgi:hypothetical protein